MKQVILGVLGGMGPAATVDFMTKVIDLTDADADQKHIPMLVANLPDVPDRSACLLHDGESPLAKLTQYRDLLIAAGASVVAIPCNTAHFWFEDLLKTSKVPMISIVDSVVAEIKERGLERVGVVGTDATIATGLYQKKLEEAGVEFLLLPPERQHKVMEGIYLLKAGRFDEAHAHSFPQVEYLLEKGAQAVVLGCTETPVILKNELATDAAHFIDSNEALAVASIRWMEKATGRKLLKR
jgi:aspartate racemase